MKNYNFKSKEQCQEVVYENPLGLILDIENVIQTQLRYCESVGLLIGQELFQDLIDLNYIENYNNTHSNRYFIVFNEENDILIYDFNKIDVSNEDTTLIYFQDTEFGKSLLDKITLNTRNRVLCFALKDEI